MAEQKYLPYGEVRWVTGTLPTDFGYTGQRAEDFGLYDYRARHYSPYLNRWIQPDTIIPDLANPQSLNRFAYVYNNSLRYTDPTGHDPLDDEWQTAFRDRHGRDPEWQDRLIRLFSIAFPDEWDWSTFYADDGSYIEGSIERIFRDERPTDRSWADIPQALENLAGHYDKGEQRLLTRDIGTLFGGLPDRFQASTCVGGHVN